MRPKMERRMAQLRTARDRGDRLGVQARASLGLLAILRTGGSADAPARLAAAGCPGPADAQSGVACGCGCCGTARLAQRGRARLGRDHALGCRRRARAHSDLLPGCSASRRTWRNCSGFRNAQRPGRAPLAARRAAMSDWTSRGVATLCLSFCSARRAGDASIAPDRGAPLRAPEAPVPSPPRRRHRARMRIAS